MSLLTIIQQSGEALREYIKRIKIANVEVIDPNKEISLSAFKVGLSNGTINHQFQHDNA